MRYLIYILLMGALYSQEVNEPKTYTFTEEEVLAFTNEIPKTVKELELLSKDAHMQGRMRANQIGTIAVAYTLWSLKRGAGKKLMKELQAHIKGLPHIKQLITLSPLTPVATHYHIRNGAKLVSINPTTQNFEYKI